MDFDYLKLENQICHRLYVATNGIMRLYRPLLKELGLTYAQYVIMMALWERDGISMGELSRVSKMDKGFLTSAIEKMKNLKYLSIKADKLDQRKKMIFLTTKGNELKFKAKCIPEEIVRCLKGEEISDEDVSTLIGLLDKINELIVRAEKPHQEKK